MFTVVSFYHSGTVKRRTRDTVDMAHYLAAREVDIYGAHKAEIQTTGTTIGVYAWRGGLTYSETK